jgi:hypothetical protein
VKERSSLKQEIAPASLAAIEFGEALLHECWIRVNHLSQAIELPAKQRQHSWNVVLGDTTGV